MPWENLKTTIENQQVGRFPPTQGPGEQSKDYYGIVLKTNKPSETKNRTIF